ncbi:3-phenylpropionate/cinnamic acid dioxygenase ferredoxin subunit [Metallosphaera sp. J1]|uniref:Rieske 2Fe-2S domain-containing protein n=1 Tax=Metallosphaera javensis (ex Hofmann et al. 2022) TaxID=99938 RepID=UPI001EDDE504|nr:Rieske 2Fe-2S domain-containing protein [Metallosphaera javensis (ex Hofmann et al. 2022)]MCG3109200.1 3-phenylpropionate/cinnamic acid dioxygenase ferredoxin subunit [Metallosphaera javensis (ex Hofmann et al. 2022)]
MEYPGKFERVCSLDEIYDGEAKVFEINRYEVLILNKNGELKAYYARCAHALGLLDETSFDGENRIVCPVHLWEYDAFTGESINPMGSTLFPLDLKVEGNDIFVKIPSVPVSEFKVKWFSMYKRGGVIGEFGFNS